MIEIPEGRLFLGEGTDANHERNGEALLLKADDLTTHGVITGMTGSGKTGLGVGLIEEALLQGIPTLILDPKGDLGNLLLTFPDLAAESFAPWVEGDDPAHVASTWRDGLASWGIDGSRLQALRDAAEMTIYTPGSTSGIPLNVVGSLQRPAEGTDAEAVLDEVQGFVSGLLGLVGIKVDPLAGKEHILLSNLIHHAWENSDNLDLAGLVARVMNPPIRKLGVFALDEFFPPAERTALAMRLNTLLASPAFAAWGQGDHLDIEALLRPNGRTGCAIVTLSHLSDDERQFVVTLVLSKLITWMRRQPGTDKLRVLVYFDEVMGFVPPTSMPASKGPILTLLKQARAFGVGLVLATQNPVDVDYKALSNAGTWMIGRLQTEQDKARLLDGLSSAAGGVDIKQVGDTIAGLDKREFVIRQPGSDAPTTFTTRWAMSYLRGPLTREQISTLMADRRSTPDAPSMEADPARGSSTEPDVGADSRSGAPSPGEHDSTEVAPTVAEGTPVRWLDPAAPWAAEVGALPNGTVFEAGVVATVDLLFDEKKADLVHREEFECVIFPLGAANDLTTLAVVDHDPRDLRPEQPPTAQYRIPDAPIHQKSYFSTLGRTLVDHLHATQTTSIFHNPELKIYSRPGESEADFAARCDAVADDGADEATAAITKRYESRIRRARDAIATAQDRVDQAEAAMASRRTDELISGAGDLLGSLFGRRSASGIARKVGSASRRRGRANEAAKRVQTAANRVDERVQALADLEADLADELAKVADEWDAKADRIEPFEVPLEKNDIRLVELALVWIPVV